MAEEPLVSNYMDTVFLTISPSISVDEAINLLVKHKVMAALVVDEQDKNKVIGLLSERDCLKLILQQTYEQLPRDTVAGYMGEAPPPISGDTPATEAAKIFMENKFRRMPVIEDGKLVGQITRRDLIRGLHEKIFSS